MGARSLRPAVLLALLASPAMASDLTVRYLGNEGFFLEAAEGAVLIDALFGEGLAGYSVVPPEARTKLEGALGPYGKVVLVLASHRHDDHFSAHAVARHLRANPEARFVSTEEAAAQVVALDPETEVQVMGLWPAAGNLLRFENRGVRGAAVRLPHGDNPAQNLGLIVELGGIVLLHMGDAQVSARELRECGLSKGDSPSNGIRSVDVALVPYWWLFSDEHRVALTELGARFIVAMHVPEADAPANYFWPARSLDGLLARLRAVAPEAWIATDPMTEQRVTFDEP